MKKTRLLFIVFLALLVCFSAFSDSLSVDMDLTLLDGNLLINKVSEIRTNPLVYSGKVLRLRGQYYSYGAGNDVQRNLIVCENSCCLEEGVKLFPAEGAKFVWPENNATITIMAIVEPAVTDSGVFSSVFIVHSIEDLSQTNR